MASYKGLGGEGSYAVALRHVLAVALPYVLVVHDSLVYHAVISFILHGSKFRVAALDSGNRALKLLGSDVNVSMLITDYWMPEMTGYELLKKVKVDEAPMEMAGPKAYIMHCLPEERGVGVTDGAIEAPNSIMFPRQRTECTLRIESCFMSLVLNHPLGGSRPKKLELAPSEDFHLTNAGFVLVAGYLI